MENADFDIAGILEYNNIIIYLQEVIIMTKLLIVLISASFLFTAAHADEASDYINTNMLWTDNDEFHRLNITQADEIRDYRNSNMLWSDNKEFHRVDSAQAYEILDYRNASMLWPDRINISQADHDLINSNMSWHGDYEFQEH